MLVVVNLPEAPGTIPCTNSSCFFLLSLEKHLLSKRESRTASACKILEAISINVNEHKSGEIASLKLQSLISRPWETAKAGGFGHVSAEGQLQVVSDVTDIRGLVVD